MKEPLTLSTGGKNTVKKRLSLGTAIADFFLVAGCIQGLQTPVTPPSFSAAMEFFFDTQGAFAV